MTHKIILGTVILAVILIVWARNNTDAVPSGTGDGLVSTNGIHWHPKLTITVRGEQVLVPANTGLMGGHRPIHTHDETDGTIHLEFDQVVRDENITLGEFFNIWGKEFSSTQLFENHNSDTEKVRLMVNGEENTEFENYVFKDGDDIQISFE